MIDGSAFSVLEIILGALNLPNHLIAGAGGSSLIGNGGNNTLQGGAGVDFFIYNGGNDIIDNYANGDVIKFDANFTSIGISENNFAINSDNGAVIIRDAVNKIIAVEGADNNIVARAYISENAGQLDGRGVGGLQVIIGGGNGGDTIYVDDEGSSIWGGAGNFNDKIFGSEGRDEIFYVYGNGQDELFNVDSEDVVNLFGVNLNQISDAVINENGVTAKFNDGGSLNITGRAGKFILEGKTYRADYENKTWVEDGAVSDSAVTLTRTEGTNNFTYANGDGDVVIADYVEGQDVIKLQSGLILNTSYKGDDVIFMVGGDYVTVKNGKGKNITITDAFGNTSTANYTPNENVTEINEDEMLDSLHEASEKGLQAFVNAFRNVNFQELADTATNDTETKLIESLHTVYNISNELLNSRIYKESDLAVSADADDVQVMTIDNFGEKIDEIKKFNEFIGNVEVILDESIFVPPGIKALFSMGKLAVTLVETYIATDGDIKNDINLAEQILDTGGHLSGYVAGMSYYLERSNANKEIVKESANELGNDAIAAADIVTALVTGITNSVSDWAELNADGQMKSEEWGHVFSTFIVDGAMNIIPILGPIFSIFPEDVKEATKDEIADAFISDSTYLLKDKHGAFFRANASVDNVNASGRNQAVFIRGNGYANSILGGKGNDTIDGYSASDILIGKDGDDSLIGGSDNDTIYGSKGKDTLTGDYYGGYNPYITNKEHNENPGIDSHIYYTKDNFIGSDTFVYSSGDGHDVIMDYKPDEDKIYLSDCNITDSWLDGSDVILKIDEGSITLKNATGKKITVEDKDGNIDSKIYHGTTKNDGIITAAVQYNGHSYYLFNLETTWIEAQKRCESMGGHLATITDESEQTEVEKFLKATKNPKKFYYSGGYLGDDYKWNWISDETFNYTNWGNGEPDNVYGENRMMIYHHGGIHDFGEWNDVVESGYLKDNYLVSQFGFICEWDYTRSSANSADIFEDTNFTSANNLDAIVNLDVNESLTENFTALLNSYGMNQNDSLNSILAYSNG